MWGRVSKRRFEENVDDDHKSKKVAQEGIVDLTMGDAAAKNQEFKRRAMDEVGGLFQGMTLAEAMTEVAKHSWQVSCS